MTMLEEACAALRLRQGRGRQDAPEAPAATLAGIRFGTVCSARWPGERSATALTALRAPSRLPGRTRAHVVAEVALQARAIGWRLDPADEAAQDPEAAAHLADTDGCAALPARALRHLFDHTAIHLNVVLRDLPGAARDADARALAEARARRIGQAAHDPGSGARLRDLSAPYRP